VIKACAFLALSFLAMAPACAQSASDAEPGPQIVQITQHGGGAFGGDVALTTEVFKPKGDGPFPVVLFSHGRPGNEAQRRDMKSPISRGAALYWLRKGFAVVAPIRPGYGATGGGDRELVGARYDPFGRCMGRPDLAAPARNAVATVTAALDWTRTQPWADGKRILLVGTSTGGFASVAAAATNPPGVVGYINFAGGVGGDPARAPGKPCGTDVMEDMMRELGKTSHVPGLWLYAQNDLYWGADAPPAWHAAYVQAGAKAQFVQTDPVPGADGHQLLARGSELWSGPVDKFLKELGFQSAN
jgi:dienelactone hydrolase